MRGSRWWDGEFGECCAQLLHASYAYDHDPEEAATDFLLDEIYLFPVVVCVFRWLGCAMYAEYSAYCECLTKVQPALAPVDRVGAAEAEEVRCHGVVDCELFVKIPATSCFDGYFVAPLY